MPGAAAGRREDRRLGGSWDRARTRLSIVRTRLTLGTVLDRLARLHPDRTLVTEFGTGGLKLTYAEAAGRCVRWSGALRRTILPGDRVVLALPNAYSLFLASVAVSRAGGVAVPVNSRMSSGEIDHIIGDSQATRIIRHEDELGDGDDLPAVSADPDDIAAILYSSGTTGMPLGAQLTHRSLTSAIRVLALYPAWGHGSEAVSGLPIAHISGFSMVVLTAGLGIPVCLLRKFNPVDALDAIEQRRATMFIGVPTMYRMMMEAGAEQRDLKSVRLWASGADAMPVELARRFQVMGAALRLPVVSRTAGVAAFLDGYGMVESAGVVAIRLAPPGPDFLRLAPLSIALPGFKLRILDDDGRFVGPGEVGELAVKGRAIMRGYYANPVATREVMTDDGWLKTGDLARRSRFGLVELVGRKKDVIKHGGYSVYAAEIERILEGHPAIMEAAVLGLHSEQKGEVPVAVLHLRAEASLSEEGLRGWLKDRLSDYKIPQAFKFVDEFPRNGTDKVRKAELVALFTRL
jgi:acyl-CoA synthetase (AMP-forming)/AMP-acid ligase II